MFTISESEFRTGGKAVAVSNDAEGLVFFQKKCTPKFKKENFFCDHNL